MSVPDHRPAELTEEERWAEYQTCQKRGHESSGYVTASIPPQNVCKWCGTYYWTTTVTTLHEGMRKPKEPGT